MHAAELVKALRALDSSDGPARRAGALLRRAARGGGHDRVRRADGTGRRERRDPDDGNRPRDRLGCRRRRRRAQPHLVRELRRPPVLDAARHPAHRDRPQPRAAEAVEGRAARRRLRRFELGREDRLRVGRRGGGRERGHARRHPAQLPLARSRQGARDLQRHRRGCLGSGRGCRRPRGRGHRPLQAVDRLRRSHHASEGPPVPAARGGAAAPGRAARALRRRPRHSADHGRGGGGGAEAAGDALGCRLDRPPASAARTVRDPLVGDDVRMPVGV